MTTQFIIGPAIGKPILTNVYKLTLNWMSGDADHDEETTTQFDTVEDFGKAYAAVKAWLDMRKKYHNFCCDLTSHKSVKDMMRYSAFKEMAPIIQQATNLGMIREKEYYSWQDNGMVTGMCADLGEYFYEVGIETEQDVTCNDHIAALDRIVSMTYINADGIEHSVEAKEA